MKAQSQPLILKVTEVLSPVREEFRGYRILAAVPNLSGNSFGRAVPSFQKPWLSHQFGDFATVPDLLSGLDSAIKELIAGGYRPRF
jgi:hypothetical protein